MANIFLDLISGSDAANGLTFANRKLTFASAETAAINDDTIRLMASPAPTSLGQTATWTNNSLTVTLTTAVTANIDTGEAAWTGAANVTAGTSTTRKEGSTSASFIIAAGFTTGQVAYRAFTLTDYSAYQQISFWINASIAVAANTFRIDLCTDGVGAAAANSVTIPIALAANQWTRITINTAGALSSLITSVNLQALLDPGAVTVLLDNIIACKAVSSADSLNLRSLIGKNAGADLSWRGIKSINGTTVVLDMTVMSLQGAGQGYWGTTESVTTHKRECVWPAAVAWTNAKRLNIEGGWNTTDMSTQTGETFIGNPDGLTATFTCSANSSTVNKIGLFGWGLAVGAFITNADSVTISNCHGICGGSTSGGGAAVSDSGGFGYTLTGCYAVGNGGTGFYMGRIGTMNTCYAYSNGYMGIEGAAGGNRYNCTAIRNAQSGFNSSNRAYTNFLSCTAKDNAVTGFLNPGYKSIVANPVTSGNITAGIYHDSSGGTVFVTNASCTDSVPYYAGNAGADLCIASMYEAGVATTHKNYFDGGTVNSDTTTLHAATGFSWKFSPTTTTRTVYYPLRKIIYQIPIKANVATVISGWCRRSNTGITQTLRIVGGIIPGVGSAGTDITASNTEVADTWKKVDLASITPTMNCVVEVWCEVYGGTTYSAHSHESVVV